MLGSSVPFLLTEEVVVTLDNGVKHTKQSELWFALMGP